MIHQSIQKCRICGNAHLHSLLHLGDQALTGVFPRTVDEEVESGPIELVKCDESSGGCGLVQLRHSYAPEKMYGENYGYRSGLNRSMVDHLGYRVRKAITIANPKSGDLILDIGSNDSTTLRSYPGGYQLVGMDPTGTKFSKYYPSHVTLIPTFFTAKNFREKFPTQRAKIVTSIAMFYDLESPLEFMRDIHSILDKDGIWVFEQSYMPTMLEVNAYDTICHEHLSYYAMKQIKWMTDRADLKILDVELNNINGGSFSITVAKRSSSYTENESTVNQLLSQEEKLGVSTLKPFAKFKANVLHHRDSLRDLIHQIRSRGETVYGYGASTKGNVVLQYCGLTSNEIPAIAEVNEDKFGAYTPGSRIPIKSEAEIRRLRPNYLMVLPWHFRQGIINREAGYLNSGGNLLFPLPQIEAFSQQSLKIAA